MCLVKVIMVLCLREAGERLKDSGPQVTLSQEQSLCNYALLIADNAGELIKQPQILTSFLSIV